jgi:hypothetical protein
MGSFTSVLIGPQVYANANTITAGALNGNTTPYWSFTITYPVA